MKILLTGATALQCGSDRRPLQKLDAPAMLRDALVRLGHQVIWRKVELGEPRSWDLLITVAAPVNSLNALNALNQLWAIKQSGPVIMFWDDWQVKNVISSWRSLAVYQGWKQLRKALRGGDDKMIRLYRGCTPEQVERHGDELLTTALMLTKDWPATWTSLLLRYRWGDPNRVIGMLPHCRSYASWDPTPFVPLLNTVEMSPWWGYDFQNEWHLRERGWTCATLTQRHNVWVDKQKFAWPVRWHGNKTLTETAADGARLDTELDVQQSYRRNVGVISPPYDHAGSGWFRSRFLYAQNTLNVLYCANAEGRCLGEPYTFYGPKLVEQLEDLQLLELAHAQRAAYAKWLTPEEESVEQVRQLIETAIT